MINIICDGRPRHCGVPAAGPRHRYRHTHKHTNTKTLAFVQRSAADRIILPPRERVVVVVVDTGRERRPLDCCRLFYCYYYCPRPEKRFSPRNVSMTTACRTEQNDGISETASFTGRVRNERAPACTLLSVVANVLCARGDLLTCRAKNSVSKHRRRRRLSKPGVATTNTRRVP